MRISDWSSDVCSSDLDIEDVPAGASIGVARHDGGGHLNGESRVRGHIGCVGLIGFRASGQQTSKGDRQQYERSEEHTSELQSLMRISYAVFCLKKKKLNNKSKKHTTYRTI